MNLRIFSGLQSQFIYWFSVLCHAQCLYVDSTVMGSWKGRGNRYIQLVKVLYCKLPTNGKQLPAFPHEVWQGFELWSQFIYLFGI